MQVSLNWLKEYIDIDMEPQKVGEILTDIGLEVEGMEEVESIKGGLKGVVAGKVVECGQHPNADRLSLTKVDVGAGDPLQIVCGAPNVAKGQKVFVATVGTILYPRGGDALKIKKGKIRGETSEGMICAEDELGIGDDHDGIIVLPDDVKVGAAASDYYNIEKDFIYEIGLTPNRSDATNHLGVAKDLAAALKINYGLKGVIKLPEVDAFKAEKKKVPVEVVVENEEACPRYSGVTITGLKIKESPDWLKTRLQAIGVRTINNVVDITNFVLHELGQPLHAFDLDKIQDQKIIVKTLPEGTVFKSLDEVDRKLNEGDLIICDGKSKGMCIGGVFGGLDSGVTDKTTSIFLEAAHFHPKWIRRTSMRHNLRTDAAKVFEKGSDPSITVFALKRAALLMKELAEGKISSDIIDLYPNPIAEKEIEVRYAKANEIIGTDIPKDEIKSIFAALDMAILNETEDSLRVSVPTNKFDVTREIDVIEEILRIYGFNRVPIHDSIKSSVTIAPSPDPSEIRNLLSDHLSANGLHEMMAVSLSESRYYSENEVGIKPEQLVYVNNTSNIHLDIMRPTMLFSGLEAVLHNQNRQQTNIKLFEVGKTYRRDEEKNIVENGHLSICLTGDRWGESWINTSRKVDFFTLKAVTNSLLQRIGLTNFQESSISNEQFSFGVKYHRGPNDIVQFGKVSAKIVKGMGVRGEVFYADFNLDQIMKALKKHKILFEELNKFPSTRRDLALIVDNSVKFSDIVTIAKKQGKKLLKDINLFDLYENEAQIGKGKKSYAVSFLFEDVTKTLKDKEVDKIMNNLIKSYESDLEAVIRR